jgi:hypothetical protein
MNNNSEIDELNAICREAKAEGKLSGKNLTALYELSELLFMRTQAFQERTYGVKLWLLFYVYWFAFRFLFGFSFWEHNFQDAVFVI